MPGMRKGCPANGTVLQVVRLADLQREGRSAACLESNDKQRRKYAVDKNLRKLRRDNQSYRFILQMVRQSMQQ